MTKPQRIRKLRETLGLSQAEFGQALSRDGKPVDQNYISRIETGFQTKGGRRQPAEVGSDVQTRIEATFNVRRQWLNDGVGEMFRSPKENVDAHRPAGNHPQRLTKVVTDLPAADQVQRPAGNLVWVPVRDRGLFLRTQGKAPGLVRSHVPLLTQPAVAFEVSAVSMLPAFVPGSYVLCLRLEQPDDAVVGLPYLWETDEQLLLALYHGGTPEQVLLGLTYPPADETLARSELRAVYHVEYKLAKP